MMASTSNRGHRTGTPVIPMRPKNAAAAVRERIDEEAEQLLQAARANRQAQHLVDFIRLGLNTGMRSGEMLGLDWRRVDLKQGIVLLGAEDQKNRRLSSVPLNRTAREALLSRARFRACQCPSSPWVFCNNRPNRGR